MNLDLGTVVHYVMPETSRGCGGLQRAAMVVAFTPETPGTHLSVDLAVYTLARQEFGTPDEFGLVNRVLCESDNLVTIGNIPYDVEHNPGTFHLVTDAAPVVAPPVVVTVNEANVV